MLRNPRKGRNSAKGNPVPLPQNTKYALLCPDVLPSTDRPSEATTNWTQMYFVVNGERAATLASLLVIGERKMA